MAWERLNEKDNNQKRYFQLRLFIWDLTDMEFNYHIFGRIQPEVRGSKFDMMKINSYKFFVILVLITLLDKVIQNLNYSGVCQKQTDSNTNSGTWPTKILIQTSIKVVYHKEMKTLRESTTIQNVQWICLIMDDAKKMPPAFLS